MVEIAGTGITLRHLQILREVIRARSERAAAAVLGITQPAVSQQLKQLEALLAVQLFVRDKGRLLPTAQATALFRDTDATFAQMDRIAKTVTSIKGIDSDTISIAAPYVFSMKLIPEAIRALRLRQPVHGIQLKSGSYHEIAAHVLEGRADIGLARLPLDEKVFDWRPVAIATNVYVFYPGHRFSGKEIIRPEDLIGEPLADVEPQMHSHQMNENALRYMGEEPHLAIQVDIIGQEINYVAAGLGITSSNTFAARQFAAFPVEFRPFEPSALYHYVVFWQKGRRLGPVLQETIDIIVECATAGGSTTQKAE
ncbi:MULTISPECIES: LysR family transcriptional regulator [Rhizobium/Agrobacterium group]|uniref:LysR family transcriptional regulator n=1 Tax=Rhizobium/Agrobacterium group TaxID=227290 RepID=UPI000BCE7045|nr:MULTISPECIES: LysR family transcriptional regulator [Rhizobium/Agrobacterium group]MDH7809948.1 DNA-binding transcriptional LysR family regulator [Rhizobium sp. AN67]MDQ4409090.1 LysR family transcriptional regulator [Rhizobium sp. AN63]MQB07758.1 LysR family transcriptional regulator [Agrobacterium tumefaciens]SOD51107.1 DNA-binding transcriptional regulator, LysR family [Rhizobium sp. AN6A]